MVTPNSCLYYDKLFSSGLDFEPTSKNVYMYSCHGGTNQNFYYAKDTKRIYFELSRGQGNFCLNNPINNPSVSGFACHKDLHQQWFTDDMGRLHTGHDGKCLELNDKNNNDIIVAPCTDSGKQRFILPQALAQGNTVPVKVMSLTHEQIPCILSVSVFKTLHAVPI